jgi:hypothetical protein
LADAGPGSEVTITGLGGEGVGRTEVGNKAEWGRCEILFQFSFFFQ